MTITPEQMAEKLEELERIIKPFRDETWQVGEAGNANIVSFDGDDVTGVARCDYPYRRDAIIACQPKHVLALVEEVKRMREESKLSHEAVEELLRKLLGRKLDNESLVARVRKLEGALRDTLPRLEGELHPDHPELKAVKAALASSADGGQPSASSQPSSLE